MKFELDQVLATPAVLENFGPALIAGLLRLARPYSCPVLRGRSYVQIRLASRETST